MDGLGSSSTAGGNLRPGFSPTGARSSAWGTRKRCRLPSSGWPRNEVSGWRSPRPPMTFFSPYRHEFLRVASCVPRIEIGDPAFNVVQTLDLAHQGDAQKIALKIFPELGTFENVQAGLRTDYLFRLANHNRALVCGTGDLSELGLGWCTYGVGDHMSHYNVNASVSKTLIQHLIRFVATSGEVDEATAEILLTILATEISPELVPPDASGVIQSTEKMIGPYELQDFNLYYVTRYGFRPSKIAYLAHQ